MEGSAGKPVDRGDPRVILEHAGLPHRGVVLWLNARPQFRDKFKRDAAAGTRFWRAGTNLLAKLPKKPQRTAEQQLAADIIQLRCRDARERFLAAHAGAVYRKLTNGSRQISCASTTLPMRRPSWCLVLCRRYGRSRPRAA